MIITNKSGQSIRSLDEWLQYAPPAKGKEHWQNGRSAKELARAWVQMDEPKFPQDLSLLMSSHASTADFQEEWAIPEYETKLDNFRGKGRNHDLIIWGSVNGRKTLLAIEAKVDETFGDIISVYLTKSKLKNKQTKIPERVAQLSNALFGNKDVNKIRYQLVHAVAGALIEAKAQGADQAVFIVNEFVSQKTNALKALSNVRDYIDFVELLSGERPMVNSGLQGPIFVPGGGKVPQDIPLFIGYLRTEVSY